MRKLRFIYEMNLRFEEPVWDHSFSLRCVPASDEVQKVTIESRYIYPTDCLDETIDGFGNHKYIGHYHEYHKQFGYEIAGVAEVEGMKLRHEPLQEWYKYPSSLKRPGKKLHEYLSSKKFPEGNALERAVYLMRGLYRDFRYVPGKTDISTTAEEAMEKGYGVCQDYAHIFITLLRMAGIPARYVNGLMIGEGCTHAWVELYTGEGWYGLDPTNNLHVDDYYIKLAHGRDYNDCVLDKGTFRGCPGQTQHVQVIVEEIKE